MSIHPKPKPLVQPHERRPIDQMECPGCGVMVSRHLIACKPCWNRVPGDLKERFMGTKPGSTDRARVIADMRAHLRKAPDAEM